MAIRADVLQNILSDADAAKPVDGTRNVYEPDAYSKVMARNYALGLINEPQDGYLKADIKEGEVEFDEKGNLKKIGRMQPKLIDLRRYTANRYTKEVFGVGNAEGRRPGTYILLVLGNAIVNSIANVRDLPPTVKAFRFRHQNGEWVYEGAELLKSERVQQMTASLNPAAALTLMQLINTNVTKSAEVEGDSLDDILTKADIADEPTAPAGAKEDSLADVAKEENGNTQANGKNK